MIELLSISTQDKAALCQSYGELVHVLRKSGFSQQQAIALIDKSFRIHKLHLSTYRGSYV